MEFKGLIWTGAAHYFDTATDIALICQFYQIYKHGTYDDNKYNISMYALFVGSLLVTVYYRVTSVYLVWRFTRSVKEGILQFVFDHYLIKMICVNLFKMNSTKAMEMLSFMRGIEGGNESSFQAVITLTFLFVTGFDLSESSGVITFVSFVFSFISLVSRFVTLDKYTISPKATTFVKPELNGICSVVDHDGQGCCSFHLNRINFYFILHWFVRVVDVSFNLLFLANVWVYLNGYFLFAITAFCVVWYVMNEYYYSQDKSSAPTEWLRLLLVKPVTFVNGIASAAWLIMLDFVQFTVCGIIYFVHPSFYSFLFGIICRLYVFVGRWDYGIVSDGVETCWGFFLGGATGVEAYELKLFLCDFIYRCNVECLIFS